MKVLSFDSSSKALSVAVLDDQTLLAETSINIKKNHSITLMPVIDFLLDSLGMAASDLERIVVAQGPGSYTGLRVAVATAKTLAYALNIDLVGVSSLLALTQPGDEERLQVPLMDARRNNVYVGFYENGRAISPDRHAVFTDVLDFLKDKEKVHFVGEVSAFVEQIKEALPQATFEETLPKAALIGGVGQSLPALDVDSFVPAYLKRVEAEENWLKTHQESGFEQYVKRV